MPRRPPIDDRIHELVAELIDREDWSAISQMFAAAHPADIALVIEHSEEDVQPQLFARIPVDLKADVLAELEEQADVSWSR